jgi:hypothetical protein
MNFVRLLPVILSFLLLAAHFVRAGDNVYAYALLIILLLLTLKKSWVPWLIQLTLVIGAIEWLRTLMFVAQMRMEFGMPWARMAIIMVAVAMFTAFSSLVFRNKALRKRYSDGKTAES